MKRILEALTYIVLICMYILVMLCLVALYVNDEYIPAALFGVVVIAVAIYWSIYHENRRH